MRKRKKKKTRRKQLTRVLENYERVLENAACTEDKLTRIKEVASRAEEEASRTKSLYVDLQNKVESLLEIVDKLQRNQGSQ